MQFLKAQTAYRLICMTLKGSIFVHYIRFGIAAQLLYRSVKMPANGTTSAICGICYLRKSKPS